jgi:hypothetical protein
MHTRRVNLRVAESCLSFLPFADIAQIILLTVVRKYQTPAPPRYSEEAIVLVRDLSPTGRER